MTAITCWSPRRMTRVASHPAVLMSEFRFTLRRVAPGFAVLLDCLRQPRLFAVMRIAGSDRVPNLHHLPFLVLFKHRPLVQPIVPPVETTLLPWCAKPAKIRAAHGSRRAGRHKRCPLLNGAVTIHAVNLNGIARLAVEFPIAVAILFEVAVDAMHS